MEEQKKKKEFDPLAAAKEINPKIKGKCVLLEDGNLYDNNLNYAIQRARRLKIKFYEINA